MPAKDFVFPLILLISLIAGIIILVIVIDNKKHTVAPDGMADVRINGGPNGSFSFSGAHDIVLKDHQEEIYGFFNRVIFEDARADGKENPPLWSSNDFTGTAESNLVPETSVSGYTTHRLRVSYLDEGELANVPGADYANNGKIWVFYVSSAASDPDDVTDVPTSLDDFDNTDDSNTIRHTMLALQVNQTYNGRSYFTGDDTQWKFQTDFLTNLASPLPSGSNFMYDLTGILSGPTDPVEGVAVDALKFLQLNSVHPQSRV